MFLCELLPRLIHIGCWERVLVGWGRKKFCAVALGMINVIFNCERFYKRALIYWLLLALCFLFKKKRVTTISNHLWYIGVGLINIVCEFNLLIWVQSFSALLFFNSKSRILESWTVLLDSRYFVKGFVNKILYVTGVWISRRKFLCVLFIKLV